jgi:hypothetical protein
MLSIAVNKQLFSCCLRASGMWQCVILKVVTNQKTTVAYKTFSSFISWYVNNEADITVIFPASRDWMQKL